MNLIELNRVVVEAKRRCYVGGGVKAASSRSGSHDLTWNEAGWSYRDSYFGGTDFLGQETVWLEGQPVWAMNYYGAILRADLIDAERAGQTIKAALSAMYGEGRFLGGYSFEGSYGTYRDRSTGDVGRFFGEESIEVDGTIGYSLAYCGGLIKE